MSMDSVYSILKYLSNFGSTISTVSATNFLQGLA